MSTPGGSTRRGSALPGVRVQVHPSLRDLLTPAHRRPGVAVPADPTSTFGHLVQSVGVPLTEVGSLLLDGGAVAAADRVRPGELRMEPVRRPQRTAVWPPRFVLDVHLGGLARRLRLLGLDTAYATHADDPELVRSAAEESRVLLTQDRGLLRRRALPEGAYVRGAGTEEQLDDVLDRFAPPLAPWTRCPACNGELRATSLDEVAGQLEPGTRRSYDTFSRCTACGRAYWRGAHAARLDAVVARAERVVRARRPGSPGPS